MRVFGAQTLVIRASDSKGGEAITGALASCECSVSPEQVRALAYHRSGLAERRGQIPTAVALALFAPEPAPTAQRTVLSAGVDAPWSDVHRSVLSALGQGGAFIASAHGKFLPEELREVPRDRSVEACRSQVAARAVNKSENQGVIAVLKANQGGAFARLTGTGDSSGGLDDKTVHGALLGTEDDEKAGGFGIGRSGFGPGGGTVSVRYPFTYRPTGG